MGAQTERRGVACRGEGLRCRAASPADSLSFLGTPRKHDQEVGRLAALPIHGGSGQFTEPSMINPAERLEKVTEKSRSQTVFCFNRPLPAGARAKWHTHSGLGRLGKADLPFKAEATAKKVQKK